MAELLLRWLNHELELSTHVTNVETDFASGYLLGELLHRLNQQHNFGDFMRSSTADAKILNFCLLEPSLRNLNIKFDANVAAAIMNEKKDAAANLLYQIKIAATRLGRAPGVSTKSLERASVFPLHNRPVKLAKPSFDSENHRQFEHSVRRHAESIAALQQKKDRIAEEANKRQAYLARMAEQRELLDATKAERLHRAYIHSSFIKEALEETDSPAWRLALQKKNAREQRRAAFLQQLMKKREEAEENLTFSLRRKVKDNLDEFEVNGGSKTAISGGRVASRKSVGYGLRSLTTALGAASDKKKYSTATLAGSALNERELHHSNLLEMETAVDAIKQQKYQREKRKEALARRRKRFVQECVYTHAKIETARVSSILEDVVLRETNSEKDIRGEMGRILIYKEVARENRSMREQEYKNQREVDLFTAVNRDTSSYHNVILHFEDDSEMQTIQREKVGISVQAAAHHLSEKISEEIMTDVVDFVVFIAGKREDTMHSRDPLIFLPEETWSEFKVQFANNIKLLDAPSPPVYESPSHAELLDNHEFDKYLASVRPFRTTPDLDVAFDVISESTLFLGATEVIEDCFILGEEIKSLRWLARSEAPAGDVVEQSDAEATIKQPVTSNTPANPRQQLRILIYGPPFAGKRTQAKRLGEKHNLVVYSIHELIHAAIEKPSAIGQRVGALLASGKELPPEVHSLLVAEFISEIESKAPESEGSASAGWVIFDLPATKQHDQSLEERLTGYVDPSLIVSPYDFESRIAPGRKKPALPPTFLHGKSGVDLVFHLDCPMSTVLDRCLGSVEDFATKEAFHLVFNPPPDESTTRHRLQHVNSSPCTSELLSLHCLSNDDFSREHKAWYEKFLTLHEQQSSGLTVDEVQNAMASIVSEFLQKRQDEAESEQLHQEAAEQQLMASEEDRHWRIFAFEASLDEAKIGVAKIERLIAEAEEAKAKKEEMLELRQTLEEAQRNLEGIVATVHDWVQEEQALRPKPSSKYSGDLTPSIAAALSASWDSSEKEYISSMKTCFALLRDQRRRITDRVQTTTTDFCEFVRRPDLKQDIVNQFQRRFNEVVEEMRFDHLTKVELHARVDILQDELGDLVGTKGVENEEELNSIVGDGWTEDTCQQVAAIYQMALQAECDRFRVSVQLLVDGYHFASPDRSQLSSIMESWQAYQPRLDLVCKVYRDPASDIPQESISAPAAASKAAPKGKGKPSVAAVVPPTTATSNEDALTESLSMTELLAEYSHVLQRCDALIEAIAPAASDATTASGEAGESFSSGTIDICKVNLVNGIRYEHSLMQARVRFLQEATEKFCDEITRSMRSIELTLRDVLSDRQNREQFAVAALIEYIRAAIEAELALPLFIDVNPEFIQRFPTTVQLREDTFVQVDSGRRLLARSPPDEPPVVEEVYEELLNQRQRATLHEALTSQSDGSGLLSLVVLVDTISALTSLPDALPNVWRRCPAHVIAEIASGFTRKQHFVDIEALLDAMSTRDDLLQQFQEDEAREKLERELQRQQDELDREQRERLQQEQEDGDAAAPAQ